MGQKVHPEAMRVGYIHDWKSNWFSERNFSDFLIEDVRIRDHITNKLAHAGLSDITIRKDGAEVEVNIHTARPGIVIGKSGSEVDALRRDLHRLTGKAIKVNILEIKRPELDAKLVAQSIAEQLVNRVAFRRAGPAAHAARGHRLRLLRGPDDVRPHRREVLDQQGRDHARGLHGPGPHVPGRARRRPERP
jgi:ribosomal protein S3